MTQSLTLLMRAAAAFTTAFSLLAACMFLFSTATPFADVALRIVICLAIAAIGIFTLTYERAPLTPEQATMILLTSGMTLALFGAAGVVWAYHNGVVSGDFEYWIMMIEMALTAQGVLTVAHLWRKRREAVPA